MNTAPARDSFKAPIRGSSLLLSGRLLTLGMTYAAQLLIVRALAKSDYGAWTYALSVITLLESVAALGLDRAITRFTSIYHEQGDHRKLIGSVVLMIGTVAATGALIVAGLNGVGDTLGRLLHINATSLKVLTILVFLVPLDALDMLLTGLSACLGRARAIFFRRHVLGPVLRLVAIALLVALNADIVFLAYGYVAASVVGVLIYLRVMISACRDAGWFANFQFTRIVIPAREIFAFTLPMLAADVAVACTESAGALVLGYFHNLSDVASFTAAVPLAAVNQIVFRNFSLMYTPAASRLFARSDFKGINDLYWRTAVWMAILTFPVFAVTFSTARAMTVFLYGTRYEATARVLSLLALGEYVNVALGFNGLTLRILNRSRYVVTISAASTVVAFALNILLVPKFGAMGAAVATATTMIMHNALKQAGLRVATGISLFDPRYRSSYAAIALCAGALVVIQWLMPKQPFIVLSLAALASVIALQLCKRVMRVAEVFPEVLRVPVLGAWLA